MSESQSFDNAEQIMSWLKMTEMPLEDLSQETSFVSNELRFSPVPGADSTRDGSPRNSELVHTGS